jgi:hypothetical protein
VRCRQLPLWNSENLVSRWKEGLPWRSCISDIASLVIHDVVLCVVVNISVGCEVVSKGGIFLLLNMLHVTHDLAARFTFSFRSH